METFNCRMSDHSRNILRPFGNLVVRLYIFSHFGMLYRSKSGNPDPCMCVCDILGSLLRCKTKRLLPVITRSSRDIHSTWLACRVITSIGRIFALWAIVYFGLFFASYISGTFGLLFSQDHSSDFDKMWAGLHFGQLFSQSHPVTLLACCNFADTTMTERK
jgi:hypothetical protein